MQQRQLHGFVDDVLAQITSTAVDTATEAAQPFLNDIEKRVRGLLFPVVLFTAASFVLNLLTYREVRKKP